MYFSEAYPQAAGGEWFDPLMEIDTQLFVDPFLIFHEREGFWAGANEEIVDYFQMVFEILAGHHDRPESPQYQKALDLMLFPEPREFGLGYVAEGTGGSGTGKGFAGRMVHAMALAIEAGLSDLRHFEELGLLVDRIGRDRISDITCNILKPRFIQYTQDICRELEIPVSGMQVEHSVYDPIRRRWQAGVFDLPKNPLTGGPVILVPKRFLRELPSLNVLDWWNYVEPTLRVDLNLAIADKLSKERIIELARQHPDLVREWSEARESLPPRPYPIDRDPEGLHKWQLMTKDVASRFELDLVSVGPGDLDDFVEKVNRSFAHFVEEGGGWRLLWNEDRMKPRREVSIQLLYKGVVQSYCMAYNVALDREVELGRGPVDFVFTHTARDRILLEIKRMSNGRFWNGLEDQLTSYMRSDRCDRGWFLAVRFTNTRGEQERWATLRERTQKASDATGFSLRSMAVDARPKDSASKLPAEGDELGDEIFDGDFDE